MVKSSSIYIGQAKMALAGKWQSAMLACSVAILISMFPTFTTYIINHLSGTVNPGEFQTYEDYQQALTSSLDMSGWNIFTIVFSFIWTLLMTTPVMLSCCVGIREMHISNKSAMDVMYLFFRENYVSLLKLMWKSALRILKWCGIPLALFLIFRLLQFLDDDYYASTRYASLASLSQFVFVILCAYKTLEYTVVSYLKNDNPDMADEDILEKSETLMKGNKMLMIKMAVRAVLPVIPIMIGLGFIFLFLVFGALFGSMVTLFVSGNMDTLYSAFDHIAPMWYYIGIALPILIFAFVISRFIMECSVLYSELIGYVPATEEEEKKDEKSQEEQKEEEKKDGDKGPDEINLEPEIPYEQRYMPK